MSGARISKSAGFRRVALLTKPIQMVILGILAMFLVTLSSCAFGNNSSPPRRGKIPVIFDTYICDDIDDTWALAMLLQSPEFDVKLITTAVRNTPSKAKVVAKFLEAVGRTDTAIGFAPHQNSVRKRAVRF